MSSAAYFATKDTITLGCDHPEAAQFQQFLIQKGWGCTIGMSTGNYVNGAHTSHNEDAKMTLNNLWEQYCAF